MKKILVLCVVFPVLILSACNRLESGRRLRLPQGSAENGKAAFIALKCTDCHTVAGVELPKPVVSANFVVELGGQVTRLRTVGDLMTSVIHPTESISSKMKPPQFGRPVTNMPDANDVMTVRQLIDVVRFLQPRYNQMEPPIDWSY